MDPFAYFGGCAHVWAPKQFCHGGWTSHADYCTSCYAKRDVIGRCTQDYPKSPRYGPIHWPAPDKMALDSRDSDPLDAEAIRRARATALARLNDVTTPTPVREDT